MNLIDDIEYWKAYATKLAIDNLNLQIALRELARVLALESKTPEQRVKEER